jgi:hypothetical protein
MSRYQTVAFSPCIAFSQRLVQEFEAQGVSARHIDGHSSMRTRRRLFDEHDAGEFKVLR